MSFVLRDWFYQITKTANKRGTRFKNGDRPPEATFKNLTDSVLFKSDQGDRAREDASNVDVRTLNGHVVASTDNQAKSHQAKKNDRTIVVQPVQLPEVKDQGNVEISFNDNTYLENYTGKDVEVIEDTTDPNNIHRNVYRVGWIDSIRTWLRDQLANLAEVLKSVAQTVDNHTTDIANINSALSTVSGGLIDVDEISPVGSKMDYLGTTDPNDNWMIADGRSLSQAAYPALYAIIGTTWGQGSSPGSTFNLPDWRGKSTKGASSAFPLGSSGGQDEIILSGDQIPPHTHPVDIDTDMSGNHVHVITWPGGIPMKENGSNEPDRTGGGAAAKHGSQTLPFVQGAGDHSHNVNGNTGNQYSGTQQVLNLNSPYLACNTIVKVQ